jgi:type IV pilus assembly protein PilV
MRVKPLRRRASPVRTDTSRGMFLLEALVALCVFSFGMLGMLGLLAGALAASGSAQWRREGFDIAAAGVARMAVEAPATLAARFDAAAGGEGYRQILAQALRLPGVTPQANAPRVTIDDFAEGRRIKVTVHWQLPGERTAHQASASAVLPHS